VINSFGFNPLETALASDKGEVILYFIQKFLNNEEVPSELNIPL